jgi:hypothetical protein
MHKGENVDCYIVTPEKGPFVVEGVMKNFEA